MFPTRLLLYMVYILCIVKVYTFTIQRRERNTVNSVAGIFNLIFHAPSSCNTYTCRLAAEQLLSVSRYRFTIIPIKQKKTEKKRDPFSEGHFGAINDFKRTESSRLMNLVGRNTCARGARNRNTQGGIRVGVRVGVLNARSD